MADAERTDGAARAGLYERLVGAAWPLLDEPVRRLHARGARAEGAFAVRRGDGRAARLLARALVLPESGAAVPLLLSVEPLADGERWRRAFDGREFVSEQRGHARRPLLAERMGRVELLFRLTAEGGALVYTQEGASLCAGPLRVRMPRQLAPRVEASERAEGGGVRVRVRVTAPLVGPLIEYEGLVEVKGGEG